MCTAFDVNVPCCVRIRKRQRQAVQVMKLLKDYLNQATTLHLLRLKRSQSWQQC